MSVTTRLKRELKQIDKEKSEMYSITLPDPNKLQLWHGTIYGPPDSPFEGGQFKVEIKIPNKYPNNPPRVQFITQIYHPNISREGGDICVDFLSDNWTPGMTIAKMLVSLLSLLTDPNADDPLESDIANQYQDDYEEYCKTAKEWTEKYAMSEQWKGGEQKEEEKKEEEQKEGDKKEAD